MTSSDSSSSGSNFVGQDGKVIVNVFYYISNKEQALSDSTVNNLGQVLSKLFKRPVELRLVRLHYPYLNSYILAQYIAINSNRYNFTRIQRAIFNALRAVKASSLHDSAGSDQVLPSYITGMKIRVSGRLLTQRSVPRQTVQTAQIGSFSGQDNVIDFGSYTTKNKKGAFTVKVWISQLPTHCLK
jgi:ribosomal protein S3